MWRMGLPAVLLLGLLGCSGTRSETAQQPTDKETARPAEMPASPTAGAADAEAAGAEAPAESESAANWRAEAEPAPRAARPQPAERTVRQVRTSPPPAVPGGTERATGLARSSPPPAEATLTAPETERSAREEEASEPQFAAMDETEPAPSAVNEAPAPVIPPGFARRMESPAVLPAPPPAIILPAGTVLEVRLADRLSTETNRDGDRFRVLLDRDLEVGERVVAARGSVLEGEIVEAVQPGKVKGRARLTFTLNRLLWQESSVPLRTNAISIEAEGSQKEDVKKVGVGAAVGGVLGAILGGKKGAAVGGAVGAGAGTAGVLLTEGKEVDIPRERLFSFRLEDEVELPGQAVP